MKILGVIPARGGSKGVPGKNIKLLLDKPLIQYTIESSLQSQLSDVIVSTDSLQIVDISKSLGAVVPFIRPEYLSTDSAKSLPVIQHALNYMEEKNSSIYDAVMMLQPTTPFRTKDDINECISKLMETDADSVISVVDVGAMHPARMKYLEGDRLIDPPFCETVENQPRQELQKMFIRNGAIYLTKREILLLGSFKGTDCRAYIMPEERSVNIDTEFDFLYAEWIKNRL